MSTPLHLPHTRHRAGPMLRLKGVSSHYRKQATAAASPAPLAPPSSPPPPLPCIGENNNRDGTERRRRRPAEQHTNELADTLNSSAPSSNNQSAFFKTTAVTRGRDNNKKSGNQFLHNTPPIQPNPTQNNLRKNQTRVSKHGSKSVSISIFVQVSVICTRSRTPVNGDSSPPRVQKGGSLPTLSVHNRPSKNPLIIKINAVDKGKAGARKPARQSKVQRRRWEQKRREENKQSVTMKNVALKQVGRSTKLRNQRRERPYGQ